MARNRIITLTTDFGWAEGYVASMKGVILDRCPDATLVDVTHEIAPGDILAGAFVLAQIWDYWPPETTHLAVVDPGVGGERRLLAARYGRGTVVCPDNGLVTLIDQAHEMREIVSVRNLDYFLPEPVGATFAGRDQMAPAAAAIAGGTALAKLGPTPDRYLLLEIPEPAWREPELIGQVVHVDRFGNCVTNITAAELAARLPKINDVVVTAAGRGVGRLRGAYTHVAAGEPLALLNSMDRLEVAVNAGSAAEVLHLARGAPVAARLEP